MSRYPDSWEYSKDKGWIRPEPDKAKPDKPEAKRLNKRPRQSKK
jgi:hypothetical protein